MAVTVTAAAVIGTTVLFITHHVPGRIGKADRIIVYISKPIRSLHPAGKNAIRLRESAYRAVIPTRIIVHQPKTFSSCSGRVVHVTALAGIGVACRQPAGRIRGPGIAHFAPRVVTHIRDLCAACIQRQAGRAELVGQQVGQHAVLVHGDTLRAGVVILHQGIHFCRADIIEGHPAGSLVTDQHNFHLGGAYWCRRPAFDLFPGRCERGPCATRCSHLADEGCILLVKSGTQDTTANAPVIGQFTAQISIYLMSGCRKRGAGILVATAIDLIETKIAHANASNFMRLANSGRAFVLSGKCLKNARHEITLTLI